MKPHPTPQDVPTIPDSKATPSNRHQEPQIQARDILFFQPISVPHNRRALCMHPIHTPYHMWTALTQLPNASRPPPPLGGTARQPPGGVAGNVLPFESSGRASRITPLRFLMLTD